jgi:hypothetical protein
MTSSGGPGLLTSAVGPADVSVDRSTLTGQRSTVNGQRVPLVSLALRLTGGPLGSGRKRKKKRTWIGSGPKFSWAGSVGPTRLGLAREVNSACGSAGRLGQGANWLGVLDRLGLQSFMGGSSWALLVLGPWRQAASSLRLLLVAGLGCLCSLSPS